MFTDFFPNTDLNHLKSTLDEYGVAVLTEVFSTEECDQLRQKIFDHIKKEYKVSEPKDFERLKSTRGGIMRHYGLAFLPEILNLKTDERTIEPFKVIWNEDNLTTSFDSIFIGPPPELIDKDFFDKTSFHFDQASNKQGFHCVQSFINLENTEHGDGCLSVLDKSHLFFNEFCDSFGVNTRGKDWFYLNQDYHVDWYKQKGCNLRNIIAPKGSMVLWDSRLVHMGTLPRKDRPSPNWRFLTYVCYTPARFQSDNDAKLKRYAYINNFCTAHWPYNVKIFDRKSNDFKKKNSLNDLSERQKTLFGL